MNSLWIKVMNHFFVVDYISVQVPGEYSYSSPVDITRRVKVFPSGEKYIRYNKRNYIFTSNMKKLYNSSGEATQFKPLTWIKEDD